MKRIVFIDTWTSGMAFTNPVAQEMADKFELYYVHANSLYNPNEGNSDLSLYCEVIDIKSRNYSIHDVLIDLKPDVAVFISMHGLFQRWANLLCEALNIPTLFFAHGVRLEGELTVGGRKRTIHEYSARAKFYGVHWYYLTRDVFRTKGPIRLIQTRGLQLFMSILEMGFSYKSFNDCPRYKWGLTYATICLSSEFDTDYFSNFVGPDSGATFPVTGHLTSGSAAHASQQHENIERKATLFLSQPLVSAKLMSKDQYLKYVLWCRDIVESQLTGEFIVRPHPRDDVDVIKSLEKEGVEISNQQDLSLDMARCQLAFGINSSVLLGFMNVGIPLVVLTDEKNILLESVKHYDNGFVVEAEKIGSQTANELAEFAMSHRTTVKKQLGSIRHPAEAICDEIYELLS